MKVNEAKRLTKVATAVADVQSILSSDKPNVARALKKLAKLEESLTKQLAAKPVADGPKKSPKGFAKYVKDHRAEVAAKYPSLASKEIMTKLSELYRADKDKAASGDKKVAAKKPAAKKAPAAKKVSGEKKAPAAKKSGEKKAPAKKAAAKKSGDKPAAAKKPRAKKATGAANFWSFY
jgi:histone H1/5